METLTEVILRGKEFDFQKAPDLEQASNQNLILINDLVGFLSKYETFPNKTINGLIAQLSPLSNEGGVIITTRAYVDKLEFNFSKEVRLCGIILPVNFAKLVQEDAVDQLLDLVFVTSLVSDYSQGKLLNVSDIAVLQKRARAYFAEAAITLQQMINNEQIPYEFNGRIQSVLHEFPKGLADFPADLRFLGAYSGN